jgi:exopolysaccharide biosynthesis polyprenyl glycosylphosphotransferase
MRPFDLGRTRSDLPPDDHGTWLLVLLFWSTGSANHDFAKIAIFWLGATLLVPGARSAVRVVLPRIRQTRQNVVIVGAGEAGQIVAMKVLAHDEYGLRLVCFVDADPRRLAPELVDVPVISTIDAFWDLTRRMHVDRVILSYSRQHDEDQLDLVHSLRTKGIHVDIVPRMFELLGEQAELHNVEALRLLGLPPISPPNQSRAKRVFDVAVSSLLLLLLSPALVVAALLVKLDSKGPALFRSERIGADGQRFTMMKLRTMRDRAEDELDALLEDIQACAEFERTHKLHNDPRVTRTGSWLRRTSLDELPQLLDVLRGRLSLVGPRPITVAEYEHFVSAQDGDGSWTGVSGYWDIPGLRPGLTGLWQINGRSAIAYAERVRLDKIYHAHWSFNRDLLILVKTIRALFVGNGAG